MINSKFVYIKSLINFFEIVNISVYYNKFYYIDNLKMQASKSKHQSPLLNFNFSFDLDLEFDTKDEMSNLKKKVKTEEEIQMCYVNEEFGPLMKALHIMKKGYEVQKKSVVSNLERYIQCDFGANDELLPLILNSIDMWDTEF